MTSYIGVDIHARQQTLSYATANKGTVTASPLQALTGLLATVSDHCAASLPWRTAADSTQERSTLQRPTTVRFPSLKYLVRIPAQLCAIFK
jgi:hypothetical protein